MLPIRLCNNAQMWNNLHNTDSNEQQIVRYIDILKRVCLVPRWNAAMTSLCRKRKTELSWGMRTCMHDILPFALHCTTLFEYMKSNPMNRLRLLMNRWMIDEMSALCLQVGKEHELNQ